MRAVSTFNCGRRSVSKGTDSILLMFRRCQWTNVRSVVRTGYGRSNRRNISIVPVVTAPTGAQACSPSCTYYSSSHVSTTRGEFFCYYRSSLRYWYWRDYVWGCCIKRLVRFATRLIPTYKHICFSDTLMLILSLIYKAGSDGWKESLEDRRDFFLQISFKRCPD